MKTLTEGSLREELQGLVLETISLDEFEPKSGQIEEIIVVGFYVVDKKPAEDLDTFIEKSYVDTLDVEVSPNPDEDGNYLVFIEIRRNKEFFKLFFKLVEEVEHVSGPQKWKVRPYLGNGKLYDLYDHSFMSMVALEKKEYVTKSEIDTEEKEKEEIQESILNSSRARILLEKESLVLEHLNKKIEYNLLDYGNSEDMIKLYKLDESPLDLRYTSSKMSILNSVLLKDWDVVCTSDFIFLNNQNINKGIILEKE